MQIVFRKRYKESHVVVAKLDSFDKQYVRQFGVLIDSELKNIERQIQSQIARYLLEEEFGIAQSMIKTNQLGKPEVEMVGVEIGISHSNEYVAVMKSSKRCGLDIELKQDKILGIKHKFVNEQEDFIFPQMSIKDRVHLIWGAKESLFKLYGKKKVDYINHLELKEGKDDSIEGLVKKEDESISCIGEYYNLENYLLVFMIED